MSLAVAGSRTTMAGSVHLASAGVGSCAASGDLSPALRRQLQNAPGLMPYVVGESDSLAGIAVRFNTTTSEIKRLNRLTNFSIFPGQKMLVPDPASAGAPSATDMKLLSCSQTSSGVSSGSSGCSSAVLSPVSHPCSAGQVTSAESTASSDQGISCRPLSSVAMVSAASPPLSSDNAIAMSASRGAGSLHGNTISEPKERERSSILPTNSEPLPLQVVTDSMVSIDAQLADLDQGIARGTLRVTAERISFQPWGADRLVRARGAELFVRNQAWSAVTSVAMFPDLIKVGLQDVPLVMRRGGGGTADFSFVSSREWSLLAPRAHCVKDTWQPSSSTTGAPGVAQSASLSGLSNGAATPPASLTAVSASSSATSIGARSSPALRLRALASSATPPLLRNTAAAQKTATATAAGGSAGSRLMSSPASSPAASPSHQRRGVNDSTQRSPGRRIPFFRQRSSSEFDEGSRLARQMQLPGYLVVRTQPLEQQDTDPEQQLIFVVAGAQKELLFNFFTNSVPRVQHVDFAQLVVFYANLRAEDQRANGQQPAAEGEEGVGEAAAVTATVAATESVTGSTLRPFSPSSDESPEHTLISRQRSCSLPSNSSAHSSLRQTASDDTWEVIDNEDVATAKLMRSISLPEGPSLETESKILSVRQLSELSRHLPISLLGHTWKLAYSTYENGISLKTMYRNCFKATEGPVLLIVCDSMQHVFGALISCTLRVCDTFDGNGTSFLYTFHDSDDCSVYRWTGGNSFFFKGDTDSLAIGGGGGSFGLWLDGDFYHGASHPCKTFDNPVLSHKPDFVCAGVEAWHFA